MSKPRYLWHGYIKSILKKYPKVSNKEKKQLKMHYQISQRREEQTSWILQKYYISRREKT